MRKYILLIFSWLLLAGVSAKDIPSKPNPPRLVNDYTGTLSESEQQQLEQKLVAYFDTTTTQIAVVIENSLEDDDLVDYCQRLATEWGIGEKDKSNGVLLYVAIQDRKVRIHTGYGMEGVLPDAICKRIIQNEIKPNFKQGNYYAGIDEATTAIIQAAAGEYVGGREGGQDIGLKQIIIIFVIIIVLLVFMSKRRGGGMGGRGGFGGPIFWGTFGSGGFSSGGGSSGGGFGGFGGGSFGGGGSSGSW